MDYAEKELLVFKAFKNILFSDSDITKITVFMCNMYNKII